MAAPRARRGKAPQRGSFRIIGGQWRGRRFDFVDDGSVRPSTDRVRETLFNWAAPIIRGAHCLDLFAGSGALGLEALSRGAASVVFVDKQPAVTRGIAEHLNTLGAEAELHNDDALRYLDNTQDRFDLVFVDPPFRQGLIVDLFKRLAGRMNETGYLYLEAEQEISVELPSGFTLLKSKSAGQVGYHWIRYHRPTDKRTE